VLVPVRFDAYRAESSRIRAIFARFTERIEPLSLDEAYLDVSHLRSAGAAVAREIRAQIFEETGLTASAGIGPNKLIAKIASDWNKPNGQFEVTMDEREAFMAALPVGKLWGVGPKSRARLEADGFLTCADLQRLGKLDMVKRLGAWGLELHDLCRGNDDREVQSHRIRKSVSSETTFAENLRDLPSLLGPLHELIDGLQEELTEKHPDRTIRGLVVKLKFADFRRTTAERAAQQIDHALFESLLDEAWRRGEGRPVRLLGVGVRLADPVRATQPDLFDLEE
jgi:DNA polymerase-4